MAWGCHTCKLINAITYSSKYLERPLWVIFDQWIQCSGYQTYIMSCSQWFYFCVPGVPYFLHCMHLNCISHVAALSAIDIGRVPCSLCRSVCLLVCWKRACILEKWLRQLPFGVVGWVGPGKKTCIKWGPNPTMEGAILEVHNGRPIVINGECVA